MGYRKYRDASLRRNYDRFADRRDDDEDDDAPATVAYDSRFIGADDLSTLTGVSPTTIIRMAKLGTIPSAGVNHKGRPIFDPADPQLAAWIAALQKARYNQRPAKASPP